MKKGFFTLLFCLISGYAVGQVTTAEDAEYLIQDVFISGSCMQSCVTESCGNYGEFIGSGGPISAGIMLASGPVSNAAPPNNAGSTSGGGGCGDPNGLLAPLIPGFSIFDASYITFEFTPSTSFVSFTYQFCSEEYPEWVGSSFNDVFGFFIDCDTCPENYDEDNFATTDGSLNGIPISINNTPGFTTSGWTEYDQCTSTFSTGIAVTPCETYELTIAVSDAGDSIYDSAILMGANSFSDGSLGSGVAGLSDGSGAQAIEGCTPGYFTLSEDPENPGADIFFTIEGSAEINIDYIIPVLGLPDADGVYSVSPGPSGTVVLPVSTFADGIEEGTETVDLILQTGGCEVECTSQGCDEDDGNAVSLEIVEDTEPEGYLEGPEIICYGSCATYNAVLFSPYGLNFANIEWYLPDGTLGQDGASTIFDFCPDDPFADFITISAVAYDQCGGITEVMTFTIEMTSAIDAGDDIVLGPFCYLDNGGAVELILQGNNPYGSYTFLPPILGGATVPNNISTFNNPIAGDGLPDANFITFSLQDPIDGNYLIQYAAGSGGACTDAMLFNIEILGPPDPPIVVDPPAVCISNGECLPGTVLASPPNGDYPYTINFYGEDPSVNPDAVALGSQFSSAGQEVAQNASLFKPFWDILLTGPFGQQGNSAATPGSYPIYVTTQYGQNCESDPAIIWITVQDCDCPTPSLYINESFTFCGTPSQDEFQPFIDEISQMYADSLEAVILADPISSCGITMDFNIYSVSTTSYNDFYVNQLPPTIQFFNPNNIFTSPCEEANRKVVIYYRCTKPGPFNSLQTTYILGGEINLLLYPDLAEVAAAGIDLPLNIDETSSCLPESIGSACPINTDLVITSQIFNAAGELLSSDDMDPDQTDDILNTDGTVVFTLTNSAIDTTAFPEMIGSSCFSVEVIVDYNCLCPTSILPNVPETHCTDTNFDFTPTDVIIADGIDDASGFGTGDPDVDVTWYYDDAFTTPVTTAQIDLDTYGVNFDGLGGANVKHIGTDPCLEMDVTIYAAMQCDLEDVSVFNPAGSYTATIFPLPQMPTLVGPSPNTSTECTYLVTVVCPDDIVSSATPALNNGEFMLPAGTDGGDATIEVSNNNGCPVPFVIPYEPCLQCPETTAPDHPESICDGALPDFAAAEATIQSGIIDDDSQILGGIQWFTDASYATPYAPAAMNHSDPTGCVVETQTVYAAIECTLNGAGFIAAGSFTVEIFPNPQSPTEIVQLNNDNTTCDYEVVVNCPGVDVPSPATFTLNPGEDGGNIDISVTNSGGCPADFNLPYIPCDECPTSTAPNDGEVICTGSVPTGITAFETTILAEITDNDQMAVGGAAPTINWFTNASLTQSYNGSALDHSDPTGCGNDTETIYAAIECSLDGSTLTVGSYEITIYPTAQTPTLVQVNNDGSAGGCDYTLNLNCPEDVLVTDSFTALNEALGYAGGVAIYAVDNGSGCPVDYSQDIDPCFECPTATPVNEVQTICTGDTPTLPNAAVIAGIVDNDNQVVGAPDVSWSFADGSPYNGGALNHSNATSCDAIDFTLNATIQCGLDGSTINAGSYVVTVWPEPSIAPVIAITSSDENGCIYDISFACPDHVLVSIDPVDVPPFQLTAGTNGGSANVEITNGFGCPGTFSIPYDDCDECPYSSQPTDVVAICTGVTPTLISDAILQTAVTDNSNTAVDNNGDGNADMFWFTDSNASTPYGNGALNHSGDLCAPSNQTLFAFIQCNINNAYIPAGSLDVSIYPNPQIPTLSFGVDPVTGNCSYALIPACPGFDSIDDGGLPTTQVPGSDGGTVTVTVTNPQGCEDTFPIDYQECNDCPSYDSDPVNQDFCFEDADVVLDLNYHSITWETQGEIDDPITDVTFWRIPGDPPTDQYNAGDLTVAAECNHEEITIYPYLQCDLDGDGFNGGSDDTWLPAGSFTISVYPDIAAFPASDFIIDGEDDCGPIIIEWPCMDQGFTISNSYDSNGPVPDYSLETSVGSIEFNLINPNIPPALSGEPCEAFRFAAYNCTDCPEVETTATGTEIFCDSDDTDLSVYLDMITWTIPGVGVPEPTVEFYLQGGIDVTNPAQPYQEGALSALNDCESSSTTIYAYMLCDFDGAINPFYAGEFTVDIYPDLSNLNANIVNDGDCGPSLVSWVCDDVPGFEIVNDFDGNGMNPDFSTTIGGSTVTWTMTNTNLDPSLGGTTCESITATADYLCVVCPEVFPSNTTQVFCDIDETRLDLASTGITWDAPVSPTEVDIAFYNNDGAVPSSPFVPGSISAAGCNEREHIVYAYVLCDKMGDGFNGGSDDEYIPAGRITITVYPVVMAPTITRQNNICDYVVNPACPNDFVDPDSFTMEPDTDAGTMTISVSTGLVGSPCPDGVFEVPFTACPPPVYEIDVPTAFSPNSDLVNDVFRLIDVGQTVIEVEFQVYDRWGHRVFMSDDLETSFVTGWDGTIGDDDAEIGVYVFYAKVVYKNNQDDLYKGNVSLIR